MPEDIQHPLVDPYFKAKQERRAKAVQCISDALTLEDTEKWSALGLWVLKRYLSEEELLSLAYVSLRSLPAEVAAIAVERTFDPEPAPPSLSLDDADIMSDARMSVACMSERMVRATAKACVEVMPPRTKRSFASWIKGGAK